ncbi:MAG: polymerase sigma factor FliA [Actinomycetota bacterium]|jgi:RNA polymerase sigma factor for flagellar operon FliA|nr:polymerase sigma factor FliA [Actinomycetota bacterium]
MRTPRWSGKEIVIAQGNDTDALVRTHVPLVAHYVSQLLCKLPPHIERADLTSAGLTALVLLARTYNPAQGTPFAQFASARIRGALIDELRGLDWVSRSTRARTRQVKACRSELAVSLSRTPTSAEIAASLGFRVRDVETAEKDERQSALLSLHDLTPEFVDNLIRDHTPSPEDLVLRRERVGYLCAAIEALPRRLRTVVVECFIHERSLSEIAKELAVTHSRVSQMRTEALTLLRDGINAQLDPDLVAARRTPSWRAVPTRRAAYYAEIAASGDLRSRLTPVDLEELLPSSPIALAEQRVHR